ncbi:MAG: Hpt domain-containing protein [Planctomycetes bacterium]|nr:Hpt domain-containing protein [Planctomycetota bacterium]
MGLIFNLDKLKAESGFKTYPFQQMCHQFLMSSAAHIDAMENALEEEDHYALINHARSLHRDASKIEAENIQEISLLMEQEKNDWPKISLQLTQLKKELALFQSHISSIDWD